MNQIRFCLVSKVSFIKWLSLALLYTPYFLFNLKYLGVESPWVEYQMTSLLTLAKYVLTFFNWIQFSVQFKNHIGIVNNILHQCCNFQFDIGISLNHQLRSILLVRILLCIHDKCLHCHTYDRSKPCQEPDILWIRLGHPDYHTCIRILKFHNVGISFYLRRNLRNMNTDCPGCNCQMYSSNILLELQPLLEFDIHFVHRAKNHKRVEFVQIQQCLMKVSM